MKKAIIALTLSTLSLCGAQLRELSIEPMQWNMHIARLIYWNWKDGAINNTSGAGYLTHSQAKYSDSYTSELTVTPRETRSSSRAEVAVAVVSPGSCNERRRAVQLGLVELKGKRFVDIALFNWEKYLKSLKLDVTVGKNFQWEHNKSYRLKLDVNQKEVSGTVFDDKNNVVWQAKGALDKESRLPIMTYALYTSALCSEMKAPAAAWGKELKAPEYPVKPRTSKYKPAANILKSYKSHGTGFFRVEQDKTGRWHLIDPLGNAMFACGIDRFYRGGRFCEALGYSPYLENMKKQFGTWEKWAAYTRKKVDSFGFNYAATADENFYDQFPFSINLTVGSSFATLGDEYDICPYKGHVGTALPNPFHPRFGEWAKRCYKVWAEADVNNPYFVGYFCDNELRWKGMNFNQDGTGVFDTVLAKNNQHTAKLALFDFLKKEFNGDISKFNKFWGKSLKSFDELGTLKELPHKNSRQTALKNKFLEVVADKYYSVIRNSLREVDPNHMLLGNRYAGTQSAPDVVWQVAGKYCDVLSFNQYPLYDFERKELMIYYTPVVPEFDRVAKLCKRPMMITEWSYMAYDSGRNNARGAGQRVDTQRERAIAAEGFLRTTLSLPYMIGMCWYQFTDDPKLGVRKTHPESCNYGLVNEENVYYKELTDMFARVQKDIDASRREGPPKTLPLNAVGAMYPLFDTPAVPKGTHSNLKLELKRNGAFCAANGELEIAYCGRGGEMEFKCGNKRLGKFYIVLKGHQDNGIRLVYPMAKKIKNISTRYGKDGIVVNFTTECVRGKNLFEADARFFLPVKGNWAMFEVIKVKNKSRCTFNMKGILVQTPPAFKPDLKDVRPVMGSYVVKNDCWKDDKGNYLGGVGTYCWLKFNFFWGSNNKYHPDVLIGTEGILTPGKTFYPRNKSYFFMFAGTDGRNAEVGKELIKRDMQKVLLAK